jgi:hypothetical protein
MNLSSSRGTGLRSAELLTSDAELREQRFIESSSRVTACHRSVSHRVVAHGGGLKTQPRFAQDLKMPQLRQQAANSA